MLAFVGFVGELAPWTVRNLNLPEPHTVYPVVDSTYLHLWLGNKPNATGGPGLEDAGPPPGSNKEMGEAVLQEFKDNPAALRRRLWAGLDFFFGEDWFKEGRLWESNPSRRGHTRRVGEDILSCHSVRVAAGTAPVGGARLALEFRLAPCRHAFLTGCRMNSSALPPESCRGAPGLLPLDGVFLCYAWRWCWPVWCLRLTGHAGGATTGDVDRSSSRPLAA